MTRHYTTKQIRDLISCPQFGDDHYGKWGGIRIEIRETIKNLCDIVDSADSVIKNQYRIIKEIENELKKYENDVEANRYAPIQECLNIINNSSWFDNKIKIKVYQSKNGLDIDKVYETNLTELIHFIRAENSRVPKPNERFIFLRRGNGPILMWYELVDKENQDANTEK